MAQQSFQREDDGEDARERRARAMAGLMRRIGLPLILFALFSCSDNRIEYISDEIGKKEQISLNFEGDRIRSIVLKEIDGTLGDAWLIIVMEFSYENNALTRIDASSYQKQVMTDKRTIYPSDENPSANRVTLGSFWFWMNILGNYHLFDLVYDKTKNKVIVKNISEYRYRDRRERTRTEKMILRRIGDNEFAFYHAGRKITEYSVSDYLLQHILIE